MSLGFFGDSEPDPGPRKFVAAYGRRKLNTSQAVRLEEVRNAVDHEVKMAEFAARAIRMFSESMLEVEWHTLSFEVNRDGMGEAYIWRWSVWAH
jgi:hypothetical protein